VLWFAFRREWRSLAICLGATALVSIATAIVAPHYWSEWIASILSNLDEPQHYSVPPPAPIRLPLAALLVAWGARTDRPWTVPVAATLALPIIWPHGLAVALAAIPFVRRGDRTATLPDWWAAARLRDYAVLLGVFVVGAVLLALLAAGPIRELMDAASSGLQPYIRRP